MLSFIRGSGGHPSHPPLTDVVIGSYTAAVIMQVFGALGWREELMAQASFFLLVLGLVVTVPTVITGLADYVTIEARTARRQTATLHMVANAVATVLFLAAAWLANDAYNARELSNGALVLSLVAYATLALAGFLGGMIVFRHGMRVEPGVDSPRTTEPRSREPDHGDTPVPG